MTSSSLQAVANGLEQVLDIRQHVEALFGVLARPSSSGHAHTRQALQDVAAKIDVLAGAWPSQISPALHQAETLDAAGSVKAPEGVEVKLGVKAEGTAATDSPAGAGQRQAASAALQHTLQLLDHELDAALLAPMASWGHTRKRARSGLEPLPPELPDAAAGSPGAELQQVVLRVRAACPGMQAYLISLSGPGAGTLNGLPKDAVEVRLHYPRTFTASIALAAAGQPWPVRVAVDAADRLNDGVAWSTSQHHVFRRISAIATRALAYFSHRAGVTLELTPKEPLSVSQGGAPSLGLAAAGNAGTPFAAMAVSTPFAATPPLPGADLFGVIDNASAAVKTEQAPGGAAGRGGKGTAGAGTAVASTPQGVALEDLLLWLAAYRDIFTRPCCASGQLLALDPPSSLPVPPVFRPFMLTRAELLDVASDTAAIQAFHAHAAPRELLGWQQDISMAPTEP